MEPHARLEVRSIANPHAVILDRQRALTVLKGKTDFDPFGLAMGDGVAHGFLDDRIQVSPRSAPSLGWRSLQWNLQVTLNRVSVFRQKSASLSISARVAGRSSGCTKSGNGRAWSYSSVQPKACCQAGFIRLNLPSKAAMQGRSSDW